MCSVSCVRRPDLFGKSIPWSCKETRRSREMAIAHISNAARPRRCPCCNSYSFLFPLHPTMLAKLSPSLLLCSILTLARRAIAQPLLTTDDTRCIGPSFLSPGQYLNTNKEPRYICSPNGLYRFGLDTSIGIILERTGELVWSAGQERGIDTQLVLQVDGNLVLRAATIQGALWSSEYRGQSQCRFVP